MTNRIRDIRRERGLTLSDLAQACDPPTTAQTIGRLETGMRSLSLGWMNRIARALEVEPEVLMRSATAAHPQIVARLTATGPEALAKPRDALMPSDLGGEGPLIALSIEGAVGEYRTGDQLWLRQFDPASAGRAVNRDVLVPRRAGRFAFGRLIDRQGTRVGILPPGFGEKQVVVDDPAWIAVAVMLNRKL